MSTATWAIYYFTWIFIGMLVPRRKRQKGYIWRSVRGTLFRWFLSKPPPHQCFRRFIVFISLIYYPLMKPFLSEKVAGVLIYSLLIVIELDDYVNGDDEDRKRRHEWVRNKVKWLMELPAKPQESKVAS